jgi:hypothetical protein
LSSATIAFAWAVAFETDVPVVLTEIETDLLEVLTKAAVLASDALAAGVIIVLPADNGALIEIIEVEINTGLATTAWMSFVGFELTSGVSTASGFGAATLCC